MAFMFPIVMLVLNVSSVAAIWFGANRIDAGEMQVGALIAFLSYLIQILMSVMMATFVAVLTPRASVCADRIEEVLDATSSVVAAGVTGHRARSHQLARAPRRRVPLPGRRLPGALRHLVHAPRPARPRPSSAAPARARPRCSTWSPGCSTRPAAPCWSTASTSATSSPSCCGAASAWCRRSRTCSPAPWPATCATPTRRPPTTSCGRRSRSPRPPTSSPPCPAASTPRSARAARTCRAASASASPSPGRSSAGRASTCSTTRSRPSTWPPTPGCGPRSAPVVADAVTVIVAQRVSTIMNADQILVLEDGRTVGLGTHHELLDDLPDLRRDRGVAAHRGGGGMSVLEPPPGTDTVEEVEEVVRPPRRSRAPASAGAAVPPGMPARALEGLQDLDPTPGGPAAARSGAASPCVLRPGRRERDAAGARRRSSSARRPTSSSTASSAADGIDFTELHRILLVALALYVVVRGARVPAVVPPRRRRAADHVPPARRRRGQAQPDAAALRRPPAPRRPAEPGHQRHRQPGPEPPADAEPDAHLDAHARRRAGHDDHDLTAAGAGRGDHDPGVAVHDAGHHQAVEDASSSPSGRHTGSLNAQVEEAFTGHCAGEGVRPPARRRGAVQREERGAVRRQLRRPVHLRDHPAGDDVPRQPELRGHRPHRRPAGVLGPDDASATSRPSSSTPASSPSRSPSWPRWSTSCSRASPRPSGCSSCSTPTRRPTDDADPRSTTSSRGAASSSTTCRSPTTRRGPLIEDLSLVAEPGQTVAIVGPTGAGKTTLVNLHHALLRARRRRHHASTASTSPRCAATTCARNMGMVLQDTWLFGGTIRENIAYGNLDATEERDPRRGAGHLRRPLRALAARTATTRSSTTRAAP